MFLVWEPFGHDYFCIILTILKSPLPSQLSFLTLCYMSLFLRPYFQLLWSWKCSSSKLFSSWMHFAIRGKFIQFQGLVFCCQEKILEEKRSRRKLVSRRSSNTALGAQWQHMVFCAVVGFGRGNKKIPHTGDIESLLTGAYSFTYETNHLKKLKKKVKSCVSCHLTTPGGLMMLLREVWW